MKSLSWGMLFGLNALLLHFDLETRPSPLRSIYATTPDRGNNYLDAHRCPHLPATFQITKNMPWRARPQVST
ncbi:MAG: hypothetical protein VB125_03445 [Burkholderia sp.]